MTQASGQRLPASLAPGDWRQLCFPGKSPELEAPWGRLWLWLGVAFLLRALVALGGDFILHPDEIMQYLEPAHGVVFGNGIVHWEYFHGARSWLVPGLVAGVLWLSDLVGLGEPWFYVYAVKLVFCAISLLIPWGAYRYARLFLPEQAARTACVLACIWPMMVIFAHKPFTEFVATAVLFGALGLAAQPASYRPAGAFAFGALVALAAFLRMQYAPLAAIVWLARVLPMRRGRTLYALLAGSLAVVLAVAIVEQLTWGAPFHSYLANFLANLVLDAIWGSESWHYYLDRTAFATGLLVLPAIWICARQPRRYLLVWLLVLVTVLLHNLQPHKEMRFIFVIFPLLAIAVAGWAHSLSNDAGRQRTAGLLVCAYSAVVALLSLVNQPGIKLLYLGTEQNETSPQIQQTYMLDIYKELSADESVTGVLHLGESYHFTPGYYYLHKKIPFYDSFTLSYAVETTGVQDIRKFVSHIVLKDEVEPLQGFTRIKQAGIYTVYTNASDIKQYYWRNYKPVAVFKEYQQLLESVYENAKPVPPDFAIELELR